MRRCIARMRTGAIEVDDGVARQLGLNTLVTDCFATDCFAYITPHVQKASISFPAHHRRSLYVSTPLHKHTGSSRIEQAISTHGSDSPPPFPPLPTTRTPLV